MNRPLFALALLALVGCGPSTRQYNVVVRNDSPEPMTVVLTKDGPPMEPRWLPPEDFAAMRQAPAELRVNGIVIPPGKTVDQAREGKFNGGTRAMLRVYRGEQNLESMLGISPSSPNRTDIPLAPGHNEILIDRLGKAARQ
ncbi:MAG TPA: hypothetical protein VF595_00265 [Tepidisphaeraceae bacterium]|jgi:hypothetical protein